ncbi:hypothetical protein [Streptomyces sp. NPDC059957]|uniref:hypothetical protein n=1 Tax=unclassified Streptomyces TaxID=2593676 RepID=UPI00364AC244
MNDFNEPVRITVPDNAIALEANAQGTAVLGVSTAWHAVVGVSQAPEGFGVKGEAISTGVAGVSSAWIGVYGESTGGIGIDAVRGQGKGGTTGVAGHSEHGIGVYGKGPLAAGKFDGKVEINGILICPQVNGKIGWFEQEVTSKKFTTQGADYAETFGSEDNFEPGTVLVIGNDGLLTACDAQYDTRATGVVSGAGGLTPGTVMESSPESAHHVTLALAGQVYVKADPQYGPISIGDLLTTSPTEGCAMRVSDRSRAVGAILGKALASLEGEPGLLRMLVTPS